MTRWISMAAVAALAALGACEGGGGGGGGAVDAVEDQSGDGVTDSGSDADITPDPGGDVDVAPDPGGDGDVTPDPGGDGDVAPDPGGDGDVTPDPGGDVVVDELGFELRLPIERHVVCEDPPDSMPDAALDQEDMDWVCTFDHGGTSAYVYVRSTAVGCDFAMSPMPSFEGRGAWISIAGVVTALDFGEYRWGGNHHNDALRFVYDGTQYEYYHSSFGFGWRACQNMDCLRTFTGDWSTLDEDGCTTERTLPAVCSRVQPDGTYDPLVDNFESCPGDPSFP